MSKKLEPFYCKPASRDEELEIAERLLANGVGFYPCASVLARLEDIMLNSGYHFIGIDPQGDVDRWVAGDGPCLKHLTIQQVRELYPYPKYDTKEDQTIYATENKHEFVPEVGQECFVVWFDGEIEKIAPLYVGKESIVFTDERCDERFVYLENIIEFRPLKTEAEISREAEIKSLQAASTHKKDHKSNEYVMMPIDEHQAENILDQGYIKPRELTDKKIQAESLKYYSAGFSMQKAWTNGFKDGARWAEKHILGKDQ